MPITLDRVIGLAKKNSLWPLPFATSCCGIEFMVTMGQGLSPGPPRHGAPQLQSAAKRSVDGDGGYCQKKAPVLMTAYTQMAEPKWVLSIGACTCSGGIYDTYSVLQGIHRIILVEGYVPGCPPHPEQWIDGILKVQEDGGSRKSPTPIHKGIRGIDQNLQHPRVIADHSRYTCAAVRRAGRSSVRKSIRQE